MIPRLYSQTPAQYRGPQTAMVLASEQARLGQSVSAVGGAIAAVALHEKRREDVLSAQRAWSQYDSALLEHLRTIPDRRDQLRATQVDGETGSTITGYQAAIDDFPDFLRAQLNTAKAGLSRAARDTLDMRFNASLPMQVDHYVQTLSHLELEDITAEIEGLAGADRLADAQELLALYADRYSPRDKARIEAAIEASVVQARLDTAQKFLQDMAVEEGWDAAAEQVADPTWQQAFGLDIGDSAATLRTLETFVSAESGRAAREQKAQIEQAGANLFADGYAGKLDDPARVDQALRGGVVSPAEAKQLYELLKKGPPTENDPDVFQEAVRRVKAAQADPSKAEATAQWLRGHAASSLRAATYESFVNQLHNPDDPLNRPSVKLLSGLIDESYNQGAFGLWSSGKGEIDLAAASEAKLAYARAKQAFMQYVQNHPEATDEQLNAEYRRLVEPEAKPRWYQRIREAFLHMGTGAAVIGWRPLDSQPITLQQADTPTQKSEVDLPLREDTPPELRRRIQRLLDAGASMEMVLDGDEVKPYVIRTK